MRLVVQRAENAKVIVEDKIIGKIEKGFVVLLGIAEEDTNEQADYLVQKLCNLRVFTDENEKMNLSIKDVKGELLIVSQFTLYADCSHGNRPSFIKAAPPSKAQPIYEYFIKACKEQGIPVQTGEFGAHMKIDFINNGPVTILLEK